MPDNPPAFLCLPDQVFPVYTKRSIVWRVLVDGKVIGADWPTKATARAGLATEQSRAKARAKKEQS